jgi:DNA-binding LytR/AlgR family response regulator
MSTNDVGLTALVVDDELPALSDLGYLLGRDERIAEVITASSGTEALQVLDGRDVDVVFSDISMPGLDGMALARVISRFTVRPQIVFVTAHDQHAVDAFALAATDYVMKPVRVERLSEAIRRVVRAQREKVQSGGPGGSGDGASAPVED